MLIDKLLSVHRQKKKIKSKLRNFHLKQIKYFILETIGVMKKYYKYIFTFGCNIGVLEDSAIKIT